MIREGWTNFTQKELDLKIETTGIIEAICDERQRNLCRKKKSCDFWFDDHPELPFACGKQHYKECHRVRVEWKVEDIK